MRGPELNDQLADALNRPTALQLLHYASSMIAASEYDDIDPPDPLPPSIDTLIDSYLEAGQPDTDALLLALAALSRDDLLRRRIRNAVRSREHPLPDWAHTIDATRINRSYAYTETLGDGEHLLIELALGGTQPATLRAYVDHNLGTLVRDAYIVDDGIDQTLASLAAGDDDMHAQPHQLDNADARARLHQAIHTGRMTYPAVETDTWPEMRALAEWVVRLMPSGGTGYQGAAWHQIDIPTPRDRFVASVHARTLDAAVREEDVAGIADTLMRIIAGTHPGDPLRWSPAAVESVLLDHVPQTVIAGHAYLAGVPAVLRGLIRYAHAERGVAPELTLETLQAVDALEGEYLRVISRG